MRMRPIVYAIFFGSPHALLGPGRNLDSHGSQVLVVGMQLAHLCAQLNIDQRMPFDTRDEIVGRRAPQRLSADAHRHTRPGVREIQNSMRSGVPSPDDDHVLALAEGRFAAAGAVVDAATEQLVHAFDVESAPVDTGRDDRDRGRDFDPAFERESHRTVAILVEGRHFAQHHDLAPETLCLPTRKP